ncbi:PAS domain-containing protein [Metabacillus sp. 113a]|uniref:STAS domain-containing protein n=1 Tax=Metabacillus sp. 113a TaxID=3404706 RepID=UPI003CF4928D
MENILINNELIKKAMDSAHIGISITDPSLLDNPLVYVNDGFIKMTGYSSDEAIGKNCRFLQGKETSSRTVSRIRESLKNEKPFVTEIYNYRKNGTAFWNELHIEPVFIESEQKTYFIGIQKDITKQREYLDKISELSTPIVPINDHLSVLPLIGELTVKRSEELMNTVSSYAAQSGDQAIIVDLSGLIKVEKDEVARLLKLYSVLNMMGTELILTGVTPLLILETSTDLIAELSGIRTYMNVKQAIKAFN